ncbi:hypothetical protein [uncultured Agrobacterium sp.]|uniref:hypothetical protein n=1 Tax=uncultured Agrobacterium sp. TaxID=157277 RepID=UPI0025E4C6EE|nr:hypothetical protein [uncultured Agrobacterium sp.]
MADYREISQEYAKQGINAAFLLNGGAAVAMLTQAGDLAEKGYAPALTGGLLLWAAGTSIAAATWILAFISTRYVDKSEREKGLEKKHLATSDRFMMAGVVTLLISIGLFGSGCWLVARAF